MKKKSIIWVLLALFLTMIPVGVFAEEGMVVVEKGLVVETYEWEDMGGEFYEGYIQPVDIKVLDGKYKGQIFRVENGIPDNSAYALVVKKGDKVVLGIEDSGEEIDIIITDYYRGDYLKVLVIMFLLIVVLIGKLKGLRSLISLAITVLGVIYIVLPGILKGQDPMVLSIIISIVVTIITILLVAGFSKKSYGAIIGTSIGVLIAGLIAFYIGSRVRLTGMSAEEASMLMFIPQEIEFNFRNLLFAGIILGSLGAVMDVGMSIASSIEEVYSANPNLTRKELFLSGMNVGSDIMGTMVNTLILAYTGSSIPLLLLFMAYDMPLLEIFNLDIIATEIVRSIAGSIGLVLTIPITALVTTYLIFGKDEKNNISKLEVK